MTGRTNIQKKIRHATRGQLESEDRLKMQIKKEICLDTKQPSFCASLNNTKKFVRI